MRWMCCLGVLLAAAVAAAAAFVSPQEKAPVDGAAAVFEGRFTNVGSIRRAVVRGGGLCRNGAGDTDVGDAERVARREVARQRRPGGNVRNVVRSRRRNAGLRPGRIFRKGGAMRDGVRPAIRRQPVTSCRFTARDAASVREVAPILRRIFLTWSLMVSRETPRMSAISLLEKPFATRLSISS